MTEPRLSVYAMSDAQLVQALLEFAKASEELRPILFRDSWEEDFVRGVRGWFVLAGTLSWKQRKVARTIVLRNYERLKRSAGLEGKIRT